MKRLLTILALLCAAKANAGILINANQINPATFLTVSSATVTNGVTGARANWTYGVSAATGAFTSTVTAGAFVGPLTGTASTATYANTATTATIAGALFAGSGISSSCPSGYYLSTPTFNNGLTTGGVCVAPVNYSGGTQTRQVLNYYVGSATASVTSGSNVLSNLQTSTGIYVGIGIKGTDIANGAYITGVFTTSATMSANATGGSATQINFTALSTGTYVLPTANGTPKRIQIRMVGGGGGGGGANSNPTFAGSTTTFNGVNANPGQGAGTSNNATGGAGGANGTGTASLRIAGGGGGGASSNGGGVGASGGVGGSSAFGGGGPVTGAASTSAAAYGSGAGGGGVSTNSQTSLSGGGAGEYVELIINSPASTYAFTVGAGGAASSLGGAGGSGIVIVDEYY